MSAYRLSLFLRGHTHAQQTLTPMRAIQRALLFVIIKIVDEYKYLKKQMVVAMVLAKGVLESVLLRQYSI